MSILPNYAQAPAEMSPARRLFVLWICCMSLLMVGLDTTIVNVALPSIHRDFNASLSGLQWIIDAYTLVIASLLVLSGSTADRIGRKFMFRLGVVLFTIGSAACAAAPSLGTLIAARALQAIGGSMLNPVAISIIRNVFEDPKERAMAFGVWSATVGISMGLGPVLGGFLVDALNWRYVFLVNVPFGIIALVLTTLFVPDSKAAHPRRPDPIGQILVIVGLASLVYAIIEGSAHGWGATDIVTLFIVAIVAFVALIVYETHTREPLIEMRFFRSAPFSCATLTAVCSFGSFGGFLFLNTLYLQDVRHDSAFDAGLMTLPIAILTLLLAPLSGKLVGRRHEGARIPLIIAGSGIAIGGGLLTRLSATTADWKLLVAYVIFGIGFGVVNPPITNTAVSGMPPAQSGVAAALASTSRQLGATLGIAVFGAVVGGGLAGGASGSAQSFVSGTHAAWWIVVALGIAIIGLGLTMTSQWALETTKRVRSLFESPDARVMAP